MICTVSCLGSFESCQSPRGGRLECFRAVTYALRLLTFDFHLDHQYLVSEVIQLQLYQLRLQSVWRKSITDVSTVPLRALWATVIHVLNRHECKIPRGYQFLQSAVPVR
jgi:hypothetical protein